MVFYNDIDRGAAAWLRELVMAGVIHEGRVDERSIRDLTARDFDGVHQAHLFAGIAGWSLALGLAGWPKDRPVWTGSCPCQPFSSAGKGEGEKDPRHLWPEMRRLVTECRPPTVFGEQVASKSGRKWFAGVRADLEALGYAVGCADLCTASQGAPHIRSRLFWVAESYGGQPSDGGEQRCWQHGFVAGNGAVGRVANGEGQRCRPGRSGIAGDEGPLQPPGLCSLGGLSASPPSRCGQGGSDRGVGRRGIRPEGAGSGPADSGGDERLGEPSRSGLEERTGQSGDDGPQQSAAERAGGEACGVTHPASLRRQGDERRQGAGVEPVAPNPGGNFWSRFGVILCRDGKVRRIPGPAEPGVQPVADGVPVGVAGDRAAGYGGTHPLSREKIKGRAGILRGAGNAIVPELAAVFIRAFMESGGLV